LSLIGFICEMVDLYVGRYYGWMDLALALVEEDHGHQVALEIARILVMFLVRPGGQSQYSHMLSRQAATSQPLRELQVWMIENLRENLSVEDLLNEWE